MARRVEKVQRELIERYDSISNLYVAYMNSGKFTDEFSREFFHAVGEIIQGIPIKQLTLFHLKPTVIEKLVNHGVSKGGVSAANISRQARSNSIRKYKKPGRRKGRKRAH